MSIPFIGPWRLVDPGPADLRERSVKDIDTWMREVANPRNERHMPPAYTSLDVAPYGWMTETHMGRTRWFIKGPSIT